MTLAVAACLGAAWHGPVPLAPAAIVVAVALGARSPSLLIVGVFALAASLGSRAVDGLTPMEPGRFGAEVTLVGDPVPSRWGARVDVRTQGRRVELQASAAAAGTIMSASAGDHLMVTGRLVRPAPDAAWLRPRHVVGVVQVEHAERVPGTAPIWQAANRFRRLLDRGSDVLDQPARSLYSGFVLGDGRDQPPEVVDDFRGSGLTHLLVVSGQNVAFLLVIISPLTHRLNWMGRWMITVTVIIAFALVTRFEPSVLRASVMAAIAITGVAVGRPGKSLRTLALAVAVLVLIDPLLVESVAFQLSVGASLAIAVIARPLAAQLRGPRVLVDSLAVTMAAQLGVAPVLIPRFGGIPIVSLFTNILAVPVAGLVTTWGLPAGVVAGVFGGSLASVAHTPTAALISIVAAVARIGARVPMGQAGFLHMAVASAAVVVAVRAERGPWRIGAIVILTAALTWPAVGLRASPSIRHARSGVTVLRSDGLTVVEVPRAVPPSALLADLRLAGVTGIDVLVVRASVSVQIERVISYRHDVEQVIEI